MNLVESVLGVPAIGNGYCVTNFELNTLSDMCPPRLSVDMDPQLFKEMASRASGARSVSMDVFFKDRSKDKKDRKVEKVIYNPPATIVWFDDGEKIVSKAEARDGFDKAKGLALCVLKKRMDKKIYNRLFPYFDACDVELKKDADGKILRNKKGMVIIAKSVPLWDVLVRMYCPNGEWEKIKKEWAK